MRGEGGVWAIVLAAGEGTRLRTLTTDRHGVAVPKQYCAFHGGASLLQRTLARTAAVVDPAALAVVVASQHRRWWQPELAYLPPEVAVVQPANRGTACGLLLPLLHVHRRDPDATVLVLPSDQFVEDEAVLRRGIVRALHSVARHRDRLVLLGVEPDRPDSEYGWIEPMPAPAGATARVAAFVEKPPRTVAERLMSRGAMWNSFVFAAGAASLLELYAATVPAIVELFADAFAALAGGADEDVLADLYDVLPVVDFSRTVLERASERLWVVPVGSCGWSDLGTPERVAACLQRLESSPPRRRQPRPAPALVLASGALRTPAALA